MKRFQKILVSVDTRFDQSFIVDEGARLARHNGAGLLLVDVMPDLPALSRLASKGDKPLLDLTVDEKQARLEQLAGSLRESGLNVETRVLEGRTSVAVIQAVQRRHADLVMRITKGRHSRNEGFFGNTAWRLLRHCPCPVWLLRHDRQPEFRHVLGCVNTSSEEPADAELNDGIVELSSSLAESHGGRYSVVHAWSLWGEHLLRGHAREAEFQRIRNDYEHRVRESLNRFLDRHDIPRDSDRVHLVHGEPQHVIPAFVHQQDVDLLVMGTVARAGLQGLVMGNDAEKILGKVSCSLLALKPEGFESTIQPED